MYIYIYIYIIYIDLCYKQCKCSYSGHTRALTFQNFCKSLLPCSRSRLSLTHIL